MELSGPSTTSAHNNCTTQFVVFFSGACAVDRFHDAARARVASVSDNPVSDFFSFFFMSSPGSASVGSDNHYLLREDDVDVVVDFDDLCDASSVAAAARAAAMPSDL